MRRCKHENADHTRKVVDDWHIVETFICEGCGEYLSLGPANDNADARIEIRAAEIAASGYSGPALAHGGRLRSMHWFEGCGWNAADHDPNQLGHQACDNGEPEDGPLHLAGYLAAIIVHHDIDCVFDEAPAIIREVQEQLRGITAVEAALLGIARVWQA